MDKAEITLDESIGPMVKLVSPFHPPHAKLGSEEKTFVAAKPKWSVILTFMASNRLMKLHENQQGASSSFTMVPRFPGETLGLGLGDCGG